MKIDASIDITRNGMTIMSINQAPRVPLCLTGCDSTTGAVGVVGTTGLGDAIGTTGVTCVGTGIESVLTVGCIDSGLMGSRVALN